MPPASAHMNVMIRAARAAARSLVRDFNEVEQLQVSVKGPGDFVSRADRASERIIRAELQRARPDYGLLLEEEGFIEGASPHNRFIVDPLDGTTNFLHGQPHWAISIGLEQHGEITAALVYDPVREELFTAEKGKGAYLNDRRLRVSRRSELRDALIGCGVPVLDWTARKMGFAQQLEAVCDEVAGVRRMGTASLDLAYVAAGRLDGFWEYGLRPWDMAGGILLVREAGGRVGRLEGDEDLLAEGTLVAGNPEVYARLRELVTAAAPLGTAAPAPVAEVG
jgi:myo-inositol-1(or 4)-monophosphatase